MAVVYDHGCVSIEIGRHALNETTGCGVFGKDKFKAVLFWFGFNFSGSILS